MKTTSKKRATALNVTEQIRQRIEAGGERVWRFPDFPDFPFAAVAQALSRLSRRGLLQRIGKGLYYRPRTTAFGPSLPGPELLERLADPRKPVFPSGIAAANRLGFTTQNPARSELATPATSLPRTLVGPDALLHTRRPATWRRLSETDASLLDLLRRRAAASELSGEETAQKVLNYFREDGRFERLCDIAADEPPRVRAMLGAIGQELGKDAKRLARLRATLNRLSRFDFGILAALAHAREWQAKEIRT